MELKDKTFIITGATSGMGRAIALRFAQAGAQLIVNGRSTSKGIELLEELHAIPSKAHFLAGDVGRASVNQQLVQQALAEFGRLDGLVANAGSLGLGRVTELEHKTWHQTFDTNIHALFYLSQWAIPHLQKQGGVIIANASIAAFKSFPNHPAYCASKAAMVALVKQMALDYGPEIRVNAICPGPVDTPLIWDSAKAFPEPDKIVQQVADNTLMKRLGQPADIAELALFLASNKSSWMTGGAITIDGGIMASRS